MRARVGEADVHVLAEELHVDGGGLAEIQDLGDDVGWLEEEFDAGKFLRQRSAQFVDINGGPSDGLPSRAIRISASSVPMMPELL